MIRHGLSLLVALVISGAPAALQMCGSHCAAPVSCHESSSNNAQSAIKAGPQLCPHTMALVAIVAAKAGLPTQLGTQASADAESPAVTAPPSDIRTSVRFEDPHLPPALRSLNLTQLRI